MVSVVLVRQRVSNVGSWAGSGLRRRRLVEAVHLGGCVRLAEEGQGALPLREELW